MTGSHVDHLHAKIKIINACLLPGPSSQTDETEVNRGTQRDEESLQQISTAVDVMFYSIQSTSV